MFNISTMRNRIASWPSEFMKTKQYNDYLILNDFTGRYYSPFYDNFLGGFSELAQGIIKFLGVECGVLNISSEDSSQYDQEPDTLYIGKLGHFTSRFPSNKDYALYVQLQTLSSINYNSASITNALTGETQSKTKADMTELFPNKYVSSNIISSYSQKVPFQSYLTATSGSTRINTGSLPSRFGAYLVFECSSDINGIYFIYIPLGTNAKSFSNNYGPNWQMDYFAPIQFKVDQGINVKQTIILSEEDVNKEIQMPSMATRGMFFDYLMQDSSANMNRVQIFRSSSIYYKDFLYDLESVKTCLDGWGLNWTQSLEEAQNKQDWPTPTPDPEPEPGIPTAPGQPENTVKNTGGKGNFDSETIVYPTSPFGTTGTGNTTYILTYEQIKYILEKVWDPSIIDIFSGFELSPIVNAILWPINMRQGVAAENPTGGVYIGKSPVPFTSLNQKIGYFLAENYDHLINFGVLQLKSEDYFGSFLDYEPYSKYKIFLPYYGFVEISGSEILDHSLSLQALLDPITGMGKYVISVDGAVRYSYDAQIGIPMMLTNTNFSDVLNGVIRNSITNFAQFPSLPTPEGKNKPEIKKENTQKIANSLISGFGKGIGNIQGSLQNFDVSTKGVTGNSIERAMPQNPYLIIERVETAIPESYNHVYGRPSMITSTLLDLQGFTQIDNPLIETTATTSEKEMIIQLLQGGVYI